MISVCFLARAKQVLHAYGAVRNASGAKFSTKVGAIVDAVFGAAASAHAMLLQTSDFGVQDIGLRDRVQV
jgi:hypothetical protein